MAEVRVLSSRICRGGLWIQWLVTSCLNWPFRNPCDKQALTWYKKPSEVLLEQYWRNHGQAPSCYRWVCSQSQSFGLAVCTSILGSHNQETVSACHLWHFCFFLLIENVLSSYNKSFSCSLSSCHWHVMVLKVSLLVFQYLSYSFLSFPAIHFPYSSSCTTWLEMILCLFTSL